MLKNVGMETIFAWVFAYQILFGSVMDHARGKVILPTQALCETARKGLITMPAIDHGAVVANDCREQKPDTHGETQGPIKKYGEKESP